jgi:hypothetical protein
MRVAEATPDPWLKNAVWWLTSLGICLAFYFFIAREDAGRRTPDGQSSPRSVPRAEGLNCISVVETVNSNGAWATMLHLRKHSIISARTHQNSEDYHIGSCSQHFHFRLKLIATYEIAQYEKTLFFLYH